MARKRTTIPLVGGVVALGLGLSACLPTGLDDAFDTDGVAVPAMSATEHDRFLAMAPGPNETVYGAGFVGVGGGDQALAVSRLLAEGTADPTFGTGGVASVNVAVGGKAAEQVRGVAVQADGKVLVAGPVEHDVAAVGDAARDTDVAIARFDLSGQLDATFGVGGVTRIDISTGVAVNPSTFMGDTPWGVVSLPGGRSAVWATAYAGPGRIDADYKLIGLTTGGTIDPGFGTGGTLTLDLGVPGQVTFDNARNLIVQDDGKIVATGYSQAFDTVVRPVIVRTSDTGVPDATFDGDGVASATVLASVAESYTVRVQPVLSAPGTYNYVLAGYGRNASSGTVDMIVYRFSSSGVFDSTFGTGGVTTIDLAGQDDRARNMVVLPDGRIVAVGSGKLTATELDGLVAVLSKDGIPEGYFGDGGHVLKDLGGPSDAFFGATLSADRSYLYLGGYKGTAAASNGDDAVVARIDVPWNGDIS